MSLSQRRCHVKPGRAKIPGISSQAGRLLFYRREHSQLKTLLFLPCCSKGFLWEKKQKAIHLALCSLIHGFKPRLPAAPPNHSSSSAHSDTQQGLHGDLPLPPVFDQDAGLSLTKTRLCFCVSEQDLHQILHDPPPEGTSPLFLISLELCPSSCTALSPSLIFTPTGTALTTRNSSWASKPIAHSCLTHCPLAHVGQKSCRGSKAQENHTSDVFLTGLHWHGDQVSSQVCCLSAPMSGLHEVPWTTVVFSLSEGEDNHIICSWCPWGKASISLKYTWASCIKPPASPSTLTPPPHESQVLSQEWKQHFQPCWSRGFCIVQNPASVT